MSWTDEHDFHRVNCGLVKVVTQYERYRFVYRSINDLLLRYLTQLIIVKEEIVVKSYRETDRTISGIYKRRHLKSPKIVFSILALGDYFCGEFTLKLRKFLSQLNFSLNFEAEISVWMNTWEFFK